MHLSKLIAKIASVIYLSTSFGAFFSADYYRKVSEDLFSNAGLTYLAGFVTLLFGLLVVNYHNVWAKNWTVLVTCLGWLALLKGLLLVVCPQFVHSLSDRMLTDGGLRIFPYTAFCLGLLFAYFGFLAAPPPNNLIHPTAD